MFNSTRFAQFLKPIRTTFQSLVHQYQTDKHAKGFSSWNQLVAMMYAQLSGTKSLRQLVEGFNAQSSHHYHLGVKELKRSTLSEANRKRSADVYQALCQQLMAGVNRQLRKELHAFTYLIDSSPIQLLGKGFDWAVQGSRVTGFKLHMQLELSNQVPVCFEITQANIPDITQAREWNLEPGSTYVMDKGYLDYLWWKKLNDQKIKLVCRLKKRAAITVIQSYELDEKAPHILEDQCIEFSGSSQKKRLGQFQMRRVVVKRDDNKGELVLITNDFERSAQEIAHLYKQRWQIELFFKWIKQHLKIKSFIGQNSNAVRIQVLSALIVYLLIKLEQMKNKSAEPLRVTFWRLAHGLFERPIQQSEYFRRKQQREEFKKYQLPLWEAGI
ncbi:IS4 family transposase [Thiomicrorhabdus sp. Milos-T2]|uniref:IS4 family transposase n=1 Tax=Thiomicrorhabdus sp. Milos-T2 TaxID=90814 RepID=UPI0006894B9B|nr:IS4 family transposase [Thiomicrorhabdus sp. Milos-T2]